MLPDKANAARRHHSPRPKRRVLNWAEYDAALRQRGRLTVWVSDEAIAHWRAAPRTTPGGQPLYSDLAMTTARMRRAVFRLALRQTAGRIGSVLSRLGVDRPVPDPSTIARRARTVTLPAVPRSSGGPIHLLVDSTGLKRCGPAEWLIEKHGTTKRRSWKKLHLGVDADSGRIVAVTLTDREGDDAAQVGALLDQIGEPITSLIGDRADDRTRVDAAIHARHPNAAVVAPPRSDAVLSDIAETAPSQRDRHIQGIAEAGRRAWQKASGDNQRAKVEGRIGGWKQVLGSALRFHSDVAQATGVAIGAMVLNRMVNLGRPNSVRVA